MRPASEGIGKKSCLPWFLFFAGMNAAARALFLDFMWGLYTREY